MRRVDKRKKANVKCEHCNYYDSENSFCNLLGEPKNYYNRCMKFKWSKRIEEQCNGKV